MLGAGLYLRGRPDVDPARIGLWGGSYGGYLTALGLARASNLFAAGVDLHGVHDWNEGIRTFIPDYHPEPERGAARLRVVADGLARRLALAGAADPWRRRPQRLLQRDGEPGRGAAGAEGRRWSSSCLPDEIHGFLRNASWLAAYHATADFFDRELKRPPAR